jgi:hypothetical protein
MEDVMKNGLLWMGLVALMACFARPASAEQACTNSSIKGVFGYAADAKVPEIAPGAVHYDPLSEVAAVSYDGAGTVNVVGGAEYHGQTTELKFSGSYTVGTDCTGWATFSSSNGAKVLVWRFVIVLSGQQVETLAMRAKTPQRPVYSSTFTQKRR